MGPLGCASGLHRRRNESKLGTETGARVSNMSMVYSGPDALTSSGNLSSKGQHVYRGKGREGQGQRCPGRNVIVQIDGRTGTPRLSGLKLLHKDLLHVCGKALRPSTPLSSSTYSACTPALMNETTHRVYGECVACGFTKLLAPGPGPA